MVQSSQQTSKPTGTNGFALAGFITALVGIPILGLIFGYVALNQIKQTKQDGHGFALAGIIISYVYLGLMVIVMVVAMVFFGIFASLFARPLVQELPNIINAAEVPANRVNVTNSTNRVNTANEPFEFKLDLN